MGPEDLSASGPATSFLPGNYEAPGLLEGPVAHAPHLFAPGAGEGRTPQLYGLLEELSWL